MYQTLEPTIRTMYSHLYPPYPTLPSTFYRPPSTLYLLFFLFLTTTLSSQNTILTGKVTSTGDGKPLIGATVQLKGTNIGAVADLDGNYILNVPPISGLFFDKEASTTLVASYQGYQTQEVALQGRTQVDFVMVSVAYALQEIVVTGSAVGLSAKKLSYAVGRLSERQISSVTTSNISQALQGKVPGIRAVQPGGQPGQSAYFQIRSATSIANGQQPLIILDGAFLNDVNLADIAVADIEKIEILKGAAGASFYGSQAANGVIQIFTRRGKTLDAGETKATIRTEIGIGQVPNSYPVNTLTNRAIVRAEGPQPVLGQVNASGIHDASLPNLQDYQKDLLFQNGLLHGQYVALEGKTSNANYLVSAQRWQENGVLQTFDGYTRHAFRANIDQYLGDKLSVQAGASYSTSTQDAIPPASNGPGSFIASTLFLTPIYQLDSGNEEDGSIYDWDIDNTGYGITNPLYERANSSQNIERQRLTGAFSANYFPREWLKFSYLAALDHSRRHFAHYLKKGFLSSNVPGQFGNLATAGRNGSNGGGIRLNNRDDQSFISRFTTTATGKSNGFNFALNASLLYENWARTSEDSKGENLAVQNVRSLNNAQSNLQISSERQDIVAYSGFLVADVDYRDKYLFSGLVRREGSSLFGDKNRWANYYRISAGYLVSEDLRIKNVQDLKLRASIGTAGNRPAFDQRFETFTLQNGSVTKNTLGNNGLKPSLSKETEIGFNATIFRAFDVEFNYVKALTKDQILLAPITGAAGFSGQWQNAGAISAKILEASLGVNFARLFRSEASGFKWYAFGTFDKVKQEVSELDIPAYTTGPGLQQSSIFLIEKGKSLGAMVGEVFATNLSQLEGQESVDPADYTINSAGYVVRKDQMGTPQERPYKLVDANGNPLVQVIGDINPTFRVGITNTIGFKGFEIYTLFDWKKGGDLYNLTKQWLYRDERHADVNAHQDITAGFYGSEGLYNVLVPNNHFVEDASFFMLREAGISLRIPNSRFWGMHFHEIQLSFTGRNIFTKTQYSGFHPDVTSAPRSENDLTNRAPDGRGGDRFTPGGDPALFYVDAFNYPVVRTWSFAVGVVF